MNLANSAACQSTGSRSAEHEQQQIECTIRQAEIELAIRTTDTLRGWFSAWCDDVPEYDLKNIIAVWARRFTP